MDKLHKKIKPVHYTGFTKNRPRKAVKFSVLVASTKNVHEVKISIKNNSNQKLINNTANI